MPFDGDPLAYYGKRIIEEHDATLLKNLPPLSPDSNGPNPFDVSNDVLHFLPRLKVGILGAGVGGLYTALILDSLGIEYDILESTDRTGGRLSTYKFPNAGKYDYYERGAMRFPLPKKNANGQYKNGIMKRLAELIEYGPLNQGSEPLRRKLIPYYYSAREGSKPGFYYFNRVLEQVSNNPKGSFDAEAMNVATGYVRAGTDAIVDDAINPFARILVEDLQTNKRTGWEVMMENDKYSTSAYMASKYMPCDGLKLPPRHLPTNVINWCELLQDSTSGFGHALTETVMDALAFASAGDTDYGDVDWKCFEGGSQTLSNKMADYIKRRVSIQFQKRVTAIGQGYIFVSLPRGFPRNKIPSSVEVVPSESTPVDIEVELKHVPDDVLPDVLPDGPSFAKTVVSIPCVTVKVNEVEIKSYSHVISTLPLPVLRTVDLKHAGLSVMQRNALRALDYGPAVKIAVLFKSNWWTTKLGIVGGQSFTDLPIRTIVYPSYGVDASPPCKVLIASYSWTSDAYRLSALSALKDQGVLKDLVLHNLAEAHGRLNTEITYEYLKREFVDMDVQDWNHDAHAMGAYAHFAPGNFQDLYTALNFPAANKRLHFAGEAISVRHAWVVGALDSAWRAVYEYLKVTGQVDKIKLFKKTWGENVEWTSKATAVHPDRVEKFKLDLLDQHLGLVDKAIQGGVVAESE
ncbi:hypothetical protein L210DRAFT_3648444 [Boletus edulis BED1]|uniref:Amine oxidase domain-containing protein n=1 Tax=Boletus edulis BED1 TaxID=1328754 RepID=A0AAD4GBT5_BOLED|nr:hypothetical protein L210DRAFT_3648444 [Boletus edulis BED1]